MIRFLEEIPSGECEAFGALPRDLAVLMGAGVRVIPTVVVPPSFFAIWQEIGSLPNDTVDCVLSHANAFRCAEHEEVFVRSSVHTPYIGLEDMIRAKKSFTALKFAIEHVYRSWGSERARAWRVTKNVVDEESLPTLLVQPYLANTCTVVTRHAISGELTTASDHNVQSTIKGFSEQIAALLSSVDTCLLRPVKLTLVCDPDTTNPMVVAIDEEVMTHEGRWRSFDDMLGRGLIDSVGFLKRVTPDMLGYFDGYGLDTDSTDLWLRGQAASPGMAIGELRFRCSMRALKKMRTPFIFLVVEAVPDDVFQLEMCNGAVGCRGGMTSHLAVICRAMNKPAVTGCAGDVDLAARVYNMPDGRAVTEGVETVVDGNTGRVGFNTSGIVQVWRRPSAADQLTSKVLRLCDELQVTGRFKRLSVADQLHLAQLKRRLREMGELQ